MQIFGAPWLLSNGSRTICPHNLSDNGGCTGGPRVVTVRTSPDGRNFSGWTGCRENESGKPDNDPSVRRHCTRRGTQKGGGCEGRGAGGGVMRTIRKKSKSTYFALGPLAMCISSLPPYHVPQKIADFGNKESASGGRFRLGSVISTVPE